MAEAQVALAKAMPPPLQERSRKALDRVMATLEEMLHERQFEKITIAELAERAGTSAGSIYARFEDKDALLLGMHRRVHERSQGCQLQLINPATWEGRSLDVVIRRTLQAAGRYYSQNGAILRATMLRQQDEVNRRVEDEIEIFSAGMTEVVMTKSSGADRRRVKAGVDAAVRAVVASFLLRQLRSQGGLWKQSNRQHIAELEIIVHAMIGHALAAPAGGKRAR
jgi:AcrR family transcriptional regulator